MGVLLLSSESVKLGLFAINYGTCADPESSIRVARHAEAAGFESVWTGEHIALPDPIPNRLPLAADLPFLDTTVALTLTATHTTTLKVASGIIILPLHSPVLLAKQLASVDVVSHGRLIVGVGAGYLREEFEAASVPFTSRQARTDEFIHALRALWTMDHPHFEGRYVSFHGIDAYPRPVQRPAPPIVVGGEGSGALTRAVTAANGWYGFALDVAECRHFTDTLRQIETERGRPTELGPLEITVTPSGPLTRSVVAQYEELGVDRLVLLPRPDAARSDRHRPVPLDRIIANIDWAADELLPR
jgi:probable F420-dependent oxidoreductase